MRTADTWRAGSRELHISAPLIMGILNITPDSFYDGGTYSRRADAMERAAEMAAEGADIIDIGGESTRPGAQEISVEEELERVLPVLEGITARQVTPISIDTRKAAVAREALKAGACIINDVSGLRDPEMAGVVSASKAGIVIMHMQGEPGTMQKKPLSKQTVIPALLAYFKERLEYSEREGIDGKQIVIDPGIGFGKTFEANEEILRRLEEFLIFSKPVLIGASRKRFIGERTGEGVEGRLFGSIAAHVIACMNGARIIRTHDIQATREALAVTAAVSKA